MPALTWRSPAEVRPDRDYVVMASRLPLKSVLQVPRFMLNTLSITGQLKRSKGIVWYSLLAHLVRHRFWTLSVWEDEDALDAFAAELPHSGIMTGLRPHMGATKFVTWTALGAEVPPTWEQALERLDSA